jgi:hypothetical protein
VSFGMDGRVRSTTDMKHDSEKTLYIKRAGKDSNMHAIFVDDLKSIPTRNKTR